jgi:PST family polysaccharide transporter
MMSKSLTDKTLTGLNWNMLNTYANAVITTVVGIVLARLLTPRDFGLIGMVLIFTGLANLFATLGMGQSVIRIKDLNENHIRVATTLTIITSVAIYIIFYITAPLMAEFFREPKLVAILRVLALLFIIGGITTVSYGQMQKDLDFKGIMIISISSNCTYGAISATLAILGYGVWSLVYGRVISSTLASIMTMKRYPVHLKPLLRKQEFKEVAGFGSGLSLSNILFYGTSNIDYLLIGRFINPYALGLYTRAFNSVTQIIEQISGGIYNVLFPAFALVQDEKEKLRKAYLRTVQTVSFILLPILFSAVIAGDYVIKGLYGSKWAGAVNSFKILTLAGILSATLRYSGAVAYATGRIYAEVFRQLIYFLVLGIGAYFLIKFGIEGVAFAVLIARVWMFLALNYLAIQIVESSWKEFLKTFIPGLANSVIMILTNAVLIFVMQNFLPAFPEEIELLIIVVVNLVVYLSLIVFMPASLKGDTSDWLIEKYGRYIPAKIVRFYFHFNTPQVSD